MFAKMFFWRQRGSRIKNAKWRSSNVSILNSDKLFQLPGVNKPYKDQAKVPVYIKDQENFGHGESVHIT